MKIVQIRMKATKDTRCECLRREQDWHLYFSGRTRPHFPVPAVHCGKVVWFPEGNTFTGHSRPYVNLLGYNGNQGIHAPGYYTVNRWVL